MCTKRIRILIMLALLALAASPGAFALKSDSSQPITITADHSESVSTNKNKVITSIYTGHVIITQGSIVIHARQATLHIKNDSIETATATGRPAMFRQQPEGGGKLIHGHAHRIIYHASANTVELIVNARITQGGRRVTAETIHYHLNNERVVANRAQQGQRRVHVVFPPKAKKSGGGGSTGAGGSQQH